MESPLFLEVSYLEHNQIGMEKVRARTKHPIRPLRSQSLELPCAFSLTGKDFLQVALRSPHTEQDVKSSGAFYLSRIFSYKLLVDNSNSYRHGCTGTVTVKLTTPPCAHIGGKVLLYMDPGSGQGVSSGLGAGRSAPLAFGPEEPTSAPLAFNWLTQGENETEFNCSVFYPGRNKYCFLFVFNVSRSLSPAQTCLVVHRSTGETGGLKVHGDPPTSAFLLLPFISASKLALRRFLCRTVGSLAAVEFVQRELWRGREGAAAWVPAALGCWGDAVYWHSEGTVHVLARGLCG